MKLDFFIHRPIFTACCSIVIVILGMICLPLLPIAQFPQLAPPIVQVNSQFTGSSSETVENSVTKPLEKGINGVDDMQYITSSSSNDGVSSIQITFDLDKDLDIAAVDVQNKISPVLPTLPEEVQRTGTQVIKTSTSMVVAYAFFSENDEYPQTFINNYVDNYIVDQLKMIDGIGDIVIAGERKYAMRIWLDPNKLASIGLEASDIVNAIKEQNVVTPAGQIGQPPNPSDQKLQASLIVQSRLNDPKQFEDIVIKTTDNGSIIRLKDVATCELGSEDYSNQLFFNSRNSIGIIIYQKSDANALELYKEIQQTITRLGKDLPPGLKYEKAFDTVETVKESINELVITIFQATVLVILIIFLFLQSWRTTIIALVTIPVSLIGTFIFMKLCGFSINTLTLFGLVLAIGIVVDDAIVVVENVQRLMEDENLNATEAASKTMKEVSGAIIATTLVLCAVFIPVAAFPGTTGQLYKQFALTIVFAVLISSFNALTLSPSLSALLLAKENKDNNWRILQKIDHFINKIKDYYHGILEKIIDFKAIVIMVFVGLIVGCFFLFKIVPSGFVPNEDQGYFLVNVQGPEGVSLNYISESMKDFEKNVLRKIPEIENVFSFSGFGFSGNAANRGAIFCSLKPIKERKRKDQSAHSIVLKVNEMSQKIPEVILASFEPPAIQGIGNFGGFQFELIDKDGTSLQDLAEYAQKLVKAGNESPILTGLFTSFSANTPQLKINVDREKAKSIGVSLSSIFSALQIYLGSVYVNDFDYLNQVFRVYVQADKQFRDLPNEIVKYYVKSSPPSNEMIPISSFLSIDTVFTASNISHYNLFRSAEIVGSEAPGYSSGQALDEMERLADTLLPASMTYQWSGISLEQKEAGIKGLIFFAFGILFVYIFLSAQYESVVDPFIIILTVPLAVFGALLAQLIGGQLNDVYCQIGLIMLVGLASKNAILIVEFANDKMKEGHSIYNAIILACQTRFRPIVMTSLAFIFGIFPLVIATGAGAASRNSMGTAVLGGMLFSTVVSLFIVPVIYIILKNFFSRKKEVKTIENE